MATVPTRHTFTLCRLCGEGHDCSETYDGWECWPCHLSGRGGYPDRRVPYGESQTFGNDRLFP